MSKWVPIAATIYVQDTDDPVSCMGRRAIEALPKLESECCHGPIRIAFDSFGGFFFQCEKCHRDAYLDRKMVEAAEAAPA